MVTLLIPPPGFIDPHDWTPLSPGTPAFQMPFPTGDTTGLADTTNYTNLVTPLIATGGVLIFQPGRYFIPQIKLYNSVEYWGSALAIASGTTGTIITAPQGSAVDMVVPAVANTNGAALRYLTFDGENGPNSAVLTQANPFNCININVQTFRPIIDNVSIFNIPGDGLVSLTGLSMGGCSFSTMRILNCYGNSVNLSASDIHLHDIEVYTSGLNGFLLSGVTIQGTNLKSNKAGARGLTGIPSTTNGCSGLAVLGSGNTISGGCFMQNDFGSFVSGQAAFTATNASPCVFTVAGAAPVNGTPIVLTGGSLPTPFVTLPTVYYVVASGVGGAGTFELAATPGGAAINSSSTGSGTATPANGNAVYVSGLRNRIEVSASGASNALLYLDAGATYNMIDLQCNNAFITTAPNFVYQINAGSVRSNRVRITGNPTVGSAYSLLTGSGTEQNNEFTVEAENYGAQSVAFAATVTPDPFLGGYVQIGTLTAPITVANPANGHAGSRIIIRLTQDATGGRTVTFGANYRISAAIPTTLSTTTEIMFVCESPGGIWREVSRATA